MIKRWQRRKRESLCRVLNPPPLRECPCIRASINGSWYTASRSVEVAEPIAPEPSVKKRKTAHNKTPAAKIIAAGPSMINPYASNVQTQTNGQRQAGPSRNSPAYAPRSPPVDRGAEDEDEDDSADEEDDGWYDHSYALSAPQGNNHTDQAMAQGGTEEGAGGYGPIDFSPQSTLGVGVMEAMGYAMNAQYWAGYWMGVARAKADAPAHSAAPVQPPSRRTRRQEPRREEEEDEDEGEVSANHANGHPTNVFVTKKQFFKPGQQPFNR